MLNATPITLRTDSVYLRELTIGEVIEIAKIPEEMNELRINAFLSYVCDDKTLPYRLTVQERYYILLNYLAVSDSQYLDNDDIIPYLLDEKYCDDFLELGDIYAKPIFGNEISLLQKRCENAYEWLSGQMAFGLYGDIGKLLALDNKAVIWQDTLQLNDNDLEKVLIERFEFINQLTDSQFSALHEHYFNGQNQLSHLLDLGIDNDGVTLLSTGGGGQMTARFPPFEALSDITKQLVAIIPSREPNHSSDFG